MTEAQVIIGIPGQWKDRSELIHNVVSKSDGYIMAGHMIFNTEKNSHFDVEIYEHNPHLKESFTHASRGTFTPYLLNDIDQHTFTVYVIAEVKGLHLQQLIEAGSALLKAGGLAIKIETSGTAYTQEDWLELSATQDPYSLYTHFASHISGGDHYYTRGMKTFGLPDAAVSSILSLEKASSLLQGFNVYNMMEKPTFHDGETFCLGENEPIYQLQLIDDHRYEEDHVFYNPFGLYQLRPFEV
ncbi:DUF4261 domain-containing protein [Marininema halotolerans]|uniref:DUF4261 domain-containing protein n=1 Tax=Marininema halotolerans TaxID=1155944 RepID=A0A1I6SV37_9BACL|nr:DUF4261 domain-containing protein [Marininema halotolerans]SFS80796.1 protein of unknown function [Marininema halotolerans]